MTINIADVLPGDIVLCRPHSFDATLQQIADEMGLPYVHTCICSKAGEVAHASLRSIERRKISVLVRGNRNLAVFRSLTPWSNSQIAAMNAFVDGCIRKEVKFSKEGIYDYKRARGAHDENVIESFFNQESLPECSFDSDTVFCSEFVAQCCAMSGRFSDGVSELFRPNVQSPKDVISDSAFSCKFVGFLASNNIAICDDDPFFSLEKWSDFIDSLQTNPESLVVDEQLINSFLNFQRAEVEEFNALVESSSLLIRFKEANTDSTTKTDS